MTIDLLRVPHLDSVQAIAVHGDDAPRNIDRQRVGGAVLDQVRDALCRARVTLIPRMLGRGDLTIIVDDGAVYLRADQVERLAGIPPWSGGETLIDDTWTVIDGAHYYDLDTATARAEAAGTHPATEFLTWLRDLLEQLLTDDVLTAATPTPSFLDAHTISTTARLLSDIPGITIGRDRLFDLLHELDWITRGPTEWQITPAARRAAWLTTRTVPVPAATRTRTRPYPQIHVTAAGLHQLRTLLTFTDPPPTRPALAAEPPLFT